MFRTARISLLSIALALPAIAAAAASVSGTITGDPGTGVAPLQGMEVRAWLSTPKGWELATTTLSAADGTYTLASLADGTYKIDARMPVGMSGNWGDRWFDRDAPTGGGYVPEVADALVLVDGDAPTGIDITLEVLGGLEGLLNVNGANIAASQVRAEWIDDPRVHHNDVTHFAGGSSGTGYYYFMRGLPPGAYRVLGHDPVGGGTAVSEGPFAVTSNANAVVPSFDVQPLPPDPYEPNGTPAGGYPVDAAATFRNATPVPFVTANASITPRGGGDVDFYCWDGVAGDRYVIDADAPLAVSGGVRDDPWVDPVLSLWTDASGTWAKIAEDDDGGASLAAPGPRLAARIDREIAQAARYCAGVTTFGDTGWNGGPTQGSAGAYRLAVAMGNRRPVASATWGGGPLASGDSVTVDEAVPIEVTFTATDPDGNPLSGSVTFRDANGADVAAGLTVTGDGTATRTVVFSWTPSQTAARNGPYLLTFNASDAELTATMEIHVVVTAVNVAPTVPTPTAPADGAVVATATPDLVFGNATDVDLDVLTYEIEVYYGATSGSPAQTPAGIAEGAGGTTTWTVASAIPEDTHASWRVRAYDGQTRSLWSSFSTLFVDVVNDPPTAPALTKPLEGEVLVVRRPALEAANPTDPEGDAITLWFEVASDAQFTQIVAQSAAVPLDTAAANTSWALDVDLVRGRSYYARARATDARGGDSGFGPAIAFSLAPNNLPAVPALGAPFGAAGVPLTLDAAPATIAVATDPDPDGDALTVELGIFAAGADPATASPLLVLSQPRDASGTNTFTVPEGTFAVGTSYVVAARAGDGMGWTDRAASALTIPAPAPPPSPKSSGGCGCGTSAPELQGLALLAAFLLRPRRRR